MPAATAPEVPSMYVEDPTPEVETETAETGEAETEEAEAGSAEAESQEGEESEEAGEGAEGETEEEAAAEEPEEKPKGHNRDAGLTKLQQRQATFERQQAEQFQAMTAKFDALTAAIANQGGKATPKQEEKLEEVKDDFEELIGKLGDEDIVEGKTLKGLLKQVAQRSKPTKATADPEVATIKQELAEIKAERQAIAEDKAFRTQFAKEYAPVSGKLDDLLDKARAEIEVLPVKLQGAAYAGAFNAAFYRIVADEMKAVKPNKPAAKVEPKKPVTPKGVQTVKTGAVTRPTTGSKQPIKMWVADPD